MVEDMILFRFTKVRSAIVKAYNSIRNNHF